MSRNKLRGSRRFSDKHCASYVFVSVGPKTLLKTQIFEKQALFPVKIRFWPIFSRIIECNKTHGKVCKGAKGIVRITVEVIKSSLTPKTLLKTHFF